MRHNADKLMSAFEFIQLYVGLNSVVRKDL